MMRNYGKIKEKAHKTTNNRKKNKKTKKGKNSIEKINKYVTEVPTHKQLHLPRLLWTRVSGALAEPTN